MPKVMNALYKQLARPLLQRVGTMIATYLVTAGSDQEMVNQLMIHLTAAALVTFDLVADKLSRKE